MTIYVDATELRENSRLIATFKHVKSDNLEALTGADILVSALHMPCETPQLIAQHIKAGAYLVQRKSGRDLINSVHDTRLYQSLAKMRATGASQPQCILLHTNWQIGPEDDKSYWSIVGALTKWNDRGGVAQYLPYDAQIWKWLQMKERHILEYQENPTKDVWPAKPTITSMETPLQVPVIINDGRITLATLPGIGEKKAQALWEEFDGNLSNIMCWLSHPQGKRNIEDKVYGIGEGIINNYRQYMGLEEIFWLTLEVMPDNLWPKEAKVTEISSQETEPHDDNNTTK